MANTRDLNHKIQSLANMKKVMGAMNMIATVKLRKLFSYQEALKLFELSLLELAEYWQQVFKNNPNAFAVPESQIKKALVICFTGDKGLCGSHNNSVLRSLDNTLANNTARGIENQVCCIGTKGIAQAKRKAYPLFFSSPISERDFTHEALNALGKKISSGILNGEFQEVLMVYNRYVSTLHQDTVCSRIFPFGSDQSKENSEASGKKPLLSVSFEPGDDSFAKKGAALYLEYRLQSALLNSHLSEQAARMTAMENASNNSSDLINRYVTLMNRARQATITNELTEIVSGKEALKGSKK